MWAKKCKSNPCIFSMLCSYYHARTASPEDCQQDVIVLSLIILVLVEEPASAERVCEFVDISSSGTGIFKTAACYCMKYLRLAGAHRDVVHELSQRLSSHPLSYLYIGVYEDIVFCFYQFQRKIVTSGKTMVFIKPSMNLNWPCSLS